MDHWQHWMSLAQSFVSIELFIMRNLQRAWMSTSVNYTIDLTYVIDQDIWLWIPSSLNCHPHSLSLFPRMNVSHFFQSWNLLSKMDIGKKKKKKSVLSIRFQLTFPTKLYVLVTENANNLFMPVPWWRGFSINSVLSVGGSIFKQQCRLGHNFQIAMSVGQ